MGKGSITRRAAGRLRRIGDFRAAQIVERLVSRRRVLRGRWQDDGRITLLTVDFRNLTPYAIRLGESFRRNVEPDGRVIVVQNGDRGNNKALRDAGFEVRGFGLNIRHGRALDWGMRFVESQYVLIADPDSLILSPEFRTMIIDRLRRHGVAGIRISDQPKHDYYHPICLAFETGRWKQGDWSFIDDLTRPELPNDVGWELTRLLGGVNEDALLPETRLGLAGQVFGEVFTNAWGTSRIFDPGNETTIDIFGGRSAALTRDYHRRWTEWVERVATGRDNVNGFPVA